MPPRFRRDVSSEQFHIVEISENRLPIISLVPFCLGISISCRELTFNSLNGLQNLVNILSDMAKTLQTFRRESRFKFTELRRHCDYITNRFLQSAVIDSNFV